MPVSWNTYAGPHQPNRWAVSGRTVGPGLGVRAGTTGVRSCRELGLQGIAVNDETGGWKPRRNQRDFEAFVRYADALADALHGHGLELFVTMAIPSEMGTSLEEVKLLLHESSVDRWLFMDPYWGDLKYVEAHIRNWSAPYAYHGPGGIGAKYAPIVWNHPEHQFGGKWTAE